MWRLTGGFSSCNLGDKAAFSYGLLHVGSDTLANAHVSVLVVAQYGTCAKELHSKDFMPWSSMVPPRVQLTAADQHDTATCAVCAAHGKNVDLMVNYPRKGEVRGPGNVSFEIDANQDKVGLGAAAYVRSKCITTATCCQGSI